jgi:glycosyltransferase involved in cell wall biosynthesis
LRLKLQQIAGEKRARIIPRNFTSSADKIAQDLIQSSVLLMPSRAEGFGLVGLEAISLGIPILITSESGLAELLEEIVPELCKDWIVPVRDDLAQDGLEWSQRLEIIVANRDAAFERAWKIRSELASRLSWTQSAKGLLDLVATVSR